LAKTPRGWTGARTPSAIKRVRQAESRRAINQPRKTAAKTYVATAVKVAVGGNEAETATALAEAMSALDRAAKVGAIHPNNAARRKSRLALKLNAITGGTAVQTTARASKQMGTAATIKAARARITAGKAVKAKGPQTAAGKAKAALSKSARAEATVAPAAQVTEAPKAAKAPKAPKAATKTVAKTAAVAKAPAKAEKAPAKVAAKTTAKAPAAAKAEKAPAKAAAAKAPAKAVKAPAKAAAPKAEKKPKA
jgi:ribosomal protein S20